MKIKIKIKMEGNQAFPFCLLRTVRPGIRPFKAKEEWARPPAPDYYKV